MTHEKADRLRKALEHATQAESEFRASEYEAQNSSVAKGVTSALIMARDILADIVSDLDRATKL